jgi:hypothetical protein
MIEARFAIPYTVREGNSSMSSSLGVVGKFPPEALDTLATIRRGQWVMVEGEVTVPKGNRGRTTINGARIAE